jgi:hypothetical protein
MVNIPEEPVLVILVWPQEECKNLFIMRKKDEYRISEFLIYLKTQRVLGTITIYHNLDLESDTHHCSYTKQYQLGKGVKPPVVPNQFHICPSKEVRSFCQVYPPKRHGCGSAYLSWAASARTEKKNNVSNVHIEANLTCKVARVKMAIPILLWVV